MSNLVLIDTACVQYYDEIITCLTPDTEYLLFSYLKDTPETLKSKITKNYSNIVIAQHNQHFPSYGLTLNMRHGRVYEVIEKDPDLTSWQDNIDFFTWLRDERGVKIIDWLACDIWSEAHWVHIIRKLESILNIKMRASTNVTGPYGDYILESDNINMIGLYFTDKILKCPENFVTSLFNVYDQNYNDPLDGSGGTLFKNKYVGILHGPFMNNNVVAQINSGYIGLSSDISNVTYVAQLLHNNTGSYATGSAANDAFIAVKSDKTGVIWGSRGSGALGQTSMYDASLVNIKRVYAGRGTFVVLKNDNTVYSCGNAPFYVDGRYNVSPYVETPNTKAIPNPLTNVKAIYNNFAGFCAIKYDGTVVAWGSRVNGGDSSVCQQYLTNITKVVVIKGWGGAFVALRSDGNFVAWKGDSGLVDTSMNSLFATSIGTSLTGRIKDILFGETSPNYILFVRDDNMICLAVVNYYKNITQAANIVNIYPKYQIPAGVTINSSEVFNVARKLVFSNETTLIIGGSNNLITDSDNILCTDGSADGGSNYLSFKLLRSGAVSPILGGNYNLNRVNGGYFNDSTFGLPPNTDVSSNVVQIFTTNAGIGALKSDGTFIGWGSGGHNWAIQYDSSANGVRNVIAVTEIQEGYRLNCADGSVKHVYSQARRDFLATQNESNKLFGNFTPETGKSIWSFGATEQGMNSNMPIELVAFERASPSSVMRYNPSTISYVSNMYHRRALQGFKYGLYCGSRLISTFKPLYDTSTFTFNNCKVPELGNNIVLTVSRLSVTFQNTMFTFTINTTENPSISVPDPPTINSISIGVERITVSLTAPSWDGGTGVDKYSYSMDGGSTWTLVDPSSSLVVTGLTGVLYTFVIRSLGGLGYSATNTSNVVMCSVPNAPTVTSSTAGNRTLTVAFTSPSGDTLTSTTFGNYSSVSSGNYTISGNANALLNGAYTFSASTNNGTNMPYHAFDNSTSTYWSTSSSSYNGTNNAYDGDVSTVIQSVGTISGEWIQIQSPTYIRVQSYSVINNQADSVAFPADFYLVGSNNGTSWFPIDNRTGQTDINSNANNIISFTKAIPQTNEFYKYYRLIVTRLNNGSQLALKDFRIVGNAVLLSSVKGYNYSLNSGAVTGFIGATQSPLVITGLNNGTSYTVSLRAVNAAGQGAASNTLAAVSLPQTIPEVPVINTLTYGDQSFVVSYTAPYNGGSAITKYQYTLDDSTYVDVSANSNPFTVSGLTNGTSYNIKMRAVNAIGTSASSALSGPVEPKRVPDAPTITSAIYSNQGGTISFSTPEYNGGSPITGYSYSLNGAASISISSSPIELSGLTNGTTYSITVKAINIVGSSSASSSSSFVPKTIPSIPIISSATVSDKQVSLAITQTSNGGSAITGYKYALDGSDVYVTVGSTTPIVITELNNGQSYSVIVKAINEVGETSDSSSVSFTPKTIPDAPTINSVSIGDRSASITFSPPIYDGDSAITGYKLSVNGGVYNSVGLISSPYDISGLTNGSAYTFALKATNIMGDSSASNISDSVVPHTVPDSPHVTVVDGDQSVSIIYTQGASTGGSDILSYTYVFGDDEPVTLSTSGTITKSVTIGQTYSFSIYATNDAGNSSNAVATILGKSVPDAPTITSVTPGNQILTIAFTNGSANSSSITGYKYKLDSGSYQTTSLVGSDIVITGLTENTSYSVVIVALNAIGQSPDSNTESATPYTNPQAPTITSISTGNSTATINYSSGSSNSSSITSHKYSLNNGAYVTLPDLSGSFVLTDLSNGFLYSMKMKSTNAAGDSSDSSSNTFMPYTNPLPPTISSVTIGNESADIFIKPGFFNGSAITGYKYCITGGDFDGTTFTYTAQVASPINITGLANGVGYTVKLKAVNAAGDSAESNSSVEFMTYVTQSSPNAPILQSAVAGDRSVQINFVDDVNPGSAIVGYKYSLNGGAYTWALQTESPLIIDKLVNGTTYTLFLKAVNSSGPSAASASSLTFTPSATPTTPTILRATPGNQSVSLKIGLSDGKGSSILGYYYQLNGTGSFIAADISGDIITISGLTNGTSYTAVIKSQNSQGDSEPSSPSEEFIPFGAPSPPTITSILPGDRLLEVHFTQGDGNGANILRYSYSTTTDGTSSSYLATEEINSPIYITGLNNGSTYTVNMKTETDYGISAASTESSPVVPYGTPEPPVITKVTITDGSANIFFVEGNNNGNTISDYLYSIDGINYVSASQTTSPIIISTFTIGDTLTIRLKSVGNTSNSSESNESDVFTVYTTPSPPVITSITPGDQKLYVYFSDPSLNGTTLLGYKYDLDDSGDLKWCKTFTSPIEISGLENGTSYLVGLKTICSEGESNLVNHTNSVFASNIQLPPKIIGITPQNNSVVIKYANPQLNGATITGYKCSINNSIFVDVDNADVDESESAITITGLQNGSSYTFALRSISDVGISSDSNTSESVTPFTDPSPPTITRVVTGSQVAYVYFTDGSLNGSSPILGYRYSLDASNYLWSTQTSSPIILNNLTNNVAYNIRIISVSASGSSAPSAPSSSFVPYTNPEPPSITNIKTGNSTVSITVADAATNGRPITGYMYSLNGGAYVSVDTTNPIVINGLTNGTTYVALIKSVSVGGASLTATASSSFVPYTVPGAPVISTLTPGNQSVTMTVTNPTLNGIVENGISIIGYSYSTDNNNYTFVDSSATTFTFSGLTNGTSYRYYVKSVCAIGISAASAQSAIVTPRNVPDAPVITGVTAGNKSGIITFTTGSNGGSPITGFKYSTDGITYVVASQTSSPISIFSLSNGVTYNIYLKATNIAGDSSASIVSPSFVPFTSLTAPVFKSVIEQFESATLNVSNSYIGTADGSGIVVTGYQYSFDNVTFFDASGTNSSATITGLLNGTSYQIYLKTVTNIGISPVSAISPSFSPKSVPQAPTITSVVPRSESGLLYFTDGSNNGSPITGYKYSLNGTTYYTALQTTSPITLYNLQNATNYNVRLRATNEAGDSIDSNISDTLTPFDVPFAPTITRIVPGDMSALVYIEEVNSNGSPIIKYRYSIGAALIDISGTSIPLVIPGLINKVNYNIKVVATNAAGDSYLSNSMSVVPGTPTVPVITETVPIPLGIRVFFTPSSDNNSPITQYSYTTGDGKFSRAVGLTSPITVVGLKNGISYNIALQAVNKNGPSLTSNSLGNRTPFDIPLKPTITSVVPIFDGAIVSFIPGSNNGSPITKFGYVVNSDTSYIDMSGVTSPITIMGLPNNVNYTIKMIAYNAAGPSISSAPSKSVKFTYTPPAQVKVTTLTASFESITVGFTAPLSNGAPITTYKYSLNGDPNYIDANTTTLPLVITGLQNNVNYNVRIIATNSAGDSIPSLPFAKPVMFTYLPTLAPSLTSAIGGNQSAQLIFTPPVPRGAPITGYKYSLNGGTTLLDASGLTSPITITGLTNDVSYNVLLYSNTAAGLSPASASRPFLPVYKVPDRPTIGTIIPMNQAGSVAFTPGASNGAPITNYLYSFDGGVTTTSANTTASPFNVSGLTNDQSYNIVLIAVNEVGNSAPSLPKTFMPLYRVPNPPIIGTITTTITGASVVFTPGSFNGSPISNYMYSIDGGELVSADRILSPIPITGLTTKTTYSIRLVAVNAVGQSALSVAKSFTTK
jgi:titin